MGFLPLLRGYQMVGRLDVPHRDFIALSPKVNVVIGADELAVTINPIYVVSLDVQPVR